MALDLPDEDRFEWPERWATRTLPWPGRDSAAFPGSGGKAALQKLRQMLALPPDQDVDLAGPAEEVFRFVCPLFDRDKKFVLPLIDALFATRGAILTLEVMLSACGRPSLSHEMCDRRERALVRMRRHLAALPKDELAGAEKQIGDLRPGTSPLLRAAISFLFPQRQDWVRADAARADSPETGFLVHSVADVESARRLLSLQYRFDEILVPITRNLGVEAFPILRDILKMGRLSTTEISTISSLLAILPLDESLELLLSRSEDRHSRPACLEAAARFPCRALRLALGRKGQEAAVREALTRWPQAAHAVRPQLAPLQLQFLDGPDGPLRIAEAPAAACPAVFSGEPRPVKWRFYANTRLPQLVLKNGAGALPEKAWEHVASMLARSDAGGLDKVRQACTAISCGRLAWAFFEAWTDTGATRPYSWAFRALGILGDDECARRLYPLLRDWPGQGLHARAVTGLEFLAEIGTDVALMLLHRLALKSKFKGLRAKAVTKIAQVAERRGLTPSQLADRLVPDLGLDGRGSLELNFGPRRFTVGFDEHLKPYVLDSARKPLKALPTAAKSDDAEKAAAAHQNFKLLKKDAREVAALQVLRLESAMCAQRRWHEAEFQRLLVEHPLLIHLVRRLIWGIFEGSSLTATFRVAEDRSLAGLDEGHFRAPKAGQVGLPHRLEMDEEVLQGWREIVADYQILQPFQQLDRAVYRRGPDEFGTKIDRFWGSNVPTGRVLGLTQLGWQRGEVQDAGLSRWMSKPLNSGLVAMVMLDPGIFSGMVGENPVQTIGEVFLSESLQTWPRENLTFSTMNEVQFSELIRDLERLRS